MEITFDPDKREATLAERGLDFLDALAVFEWPSFTMEDTRFDYAETRWLTFGMLRDRLAVVAWTPSEIGIRVISMRKCNEREKARFATRVG